MCPLADALPGLARLDAARYHAAVPFPHLVVDDFVRPELAHAVAAEVPGPEAPWIYYHHAPERKRGLSSLAAMGPATQTLLSHLQSDDFRAALATLTGIPGLLADWSLDGGGLHAMERGDFLDVHADYLAHPTRPTWQRRVNLLLYFTPTWNFLWGGHLELWDIGMAREAMIPRFNRAVIFATNETSYHGVPIPLMCPPGVVRNSLALYYFTDSGAAQPLVPTAYRALPTAPWRHTWALRADRALLYAYGLVKRYTPLGDRLASRLLRRRP